MIAAIQLPSQKLPCIVKWTGRINFHAGAITWCNKQGNAGDGVIQIPDHAKVCEACEAQIKVAYPK